MAYECYKKVNINHTQCMADTEILKLWFLEVLGILAIIPLFRIFSLHKNKQTLSTIIKGILELNINSYRNKFLEKLY